MVWTSSWQGSQVASVMQRVSLMRGSETEKFIEVMDIECGHRVLLGQRSRQWWYGHRVCLASTLASWASEDGKQSLISEKGFQTWTKDKL